MRNFVFLILAFATSISFAALPKKMCFETYPRTTYELNGVHNWTINEIVASPTAYKTYELIVTSQVKDTNGFYNFSFGGHARDNTNSTVPIGGLGYQYKDKYKIELQTNYIVGNANTIDLQPAVNFVAFWDMYTQPNPNPGNAIEVRTVLNKDMNPSPALNNVYEVAVVKVIDCKQYDRTTPTN